MLTLSCNPLIPLNIFLLKKSSICHIDGLARVADACAPTSSQSYPQLLWSCCSADTKRPDALDSFETARRVGHNRPALPAPNF
ncbi:MAG: hypothetical protein EON92_04725 [Burkholderiales bacterium]|nr:MAG: hypothetical protein EON92_04725 [Burkholderiales bacterium]